jgi:hypothetical protein
MKERGDGEDGSGCLSDCLSTECPQRTKRYVWAVWHDALATSLFRVFAFFLISCLLHICFSLLLQLWPSLNLTLVILVIFTSIFLFRFHNLLFWYFVWFLYTEYHKRRCFHILIRHIDFFIGLCVLCLWTEHSVVYTKQMTLQYVFPWFRCSK